jgi:nitrate/nitrite transport system ATP-binding protein
MENITQQRCTHPQNEANANADAKQDATEDASAGPDTETDDDASECIIRIEHAELTFSSKGNGVHTFRDLNLRIDRGEFVSLVGHSPCAKTALLNLIGGWAKPRSGKLSCDNRAISGPSPQRSIVGREHALMMHLSCYENIHLAVERVFGDVESRVQLRQRTIDALTLFGLEASAHQTPQELPCALAQCVGIARALALEPKVLLLDEPFGALHGLARAHLQDTLLRIVADTGLTVVMANSDMDDALLLSDRILMLSDGASPTITASLPVPQARPRERSAHTLAYASCEAAVMAFLSQWQAPPGMCRAA